METLKVSQITKKYGRQTILDDISLTIQPGKIYGLLDAMELASQRY